MDGHSSFYNDSRDLTNGYDPEMDDDKQPFSRDDELSQAKTLFPLLTLLV